MIAHVIHNVNSKRDPVSEILGQCDEIRIWPAVTGKTKQSGVSKAHKQIVRYAKSQKLEEILICEDDVKFTKKNALRDFISHKPKDFSIYLAGVSSFRYDSRITHFTGLHCYIIHESFYSAFLNAPEQYDIDFAISMKGKFVIHDPMLAIQHGDHLKKYWDTVRKKLNFLNKRKSITFE